MISFGFVARSGQIWQLLKKKLNFCLLNTKKKKKFFLFFFFHMIIKKKRFSNLLKDFDFDKPVLAMTAKILKETIIKKKGIIKMIKISN